MQDSKRDTDVKNWLLDYVGEEELGTVWENNIEICMLLYVKQMTSASSMREAGHLKLVLWDKPDGWDGEEGGRGVQDGGTHVHPWLINVVVWQKPPQYGNEPPIK